MLQFYFLSIFLCKNDFWLAIRPSGTEPKIKFYIEVKGHMANGSEYDKAISDADAKIALVKKDLGI